MADFGVKITLPGYDVATASNNQLVYSTEFTGLKISKHNVKATAGTVAHGLGYAPMFLNYIKIGTKYYLESQFTGSASYSDTTNVTFGSTDNYYFIFADKAQS